MESRRIDNSTYTKSDLFCPICGKQDLWIHENGGDYYVGEAYYCTSCKGSSYLDNVHEDIAPEDVIKKLKSN